MMRLGIMLIVAAALLNAPARGQGAGQGEAVDLSSPKAAARSLYLAADRGDGQAIRRIFYTETDEQGELADAYAEMIVATRRLADVARQRFGGAGDAFAQGAEPAEDIKRIDAAEVVAEGEDRASMQLPLAARPMNFRRTAAGWQLVITDFAGGAPQRIEGQIALTRDITTVMIDVAEGIESGRHATPQDAEQAIQQKMNEVMTRAVKTTPPATAPATAPATMPLTTAPAAP